MTSDSPECAANSTPPVFHRGTTVRWCGLWIGLAALFAVFFLDAWLDQFLGVTWGPKLAPAIEKLKPVFPLLMLGVVFANLPNGKRLAIGFFTPLIVHLPILHGLKWIIGRARPMRGEGPFHFVPAAWPALCGDETYKYLDAFPSGHTTAPAIVALLLGIYFPRFRWIFYLWAAVLGLERIVTRWHYTSDVVAGWLLAAALVGLSVRILGPRYYHMGPWQPADSSRGPASARHP